MCGGPWVGSIPNRFLQIMRCFENLSSGENLAAKQTTHNLGSKRMDWDWEVSLSIVFFLERCMGYCKKICDTKFLHNTTIKPLWQQLLCQISIQFKRGYVGTYQDVLILLVSPLVSLSAADESKFESESKESIPKNQNKNKNKTRNSNIKLSKSSSKIKEIFTVDCNRRRRRKKKRAEYCTTPPSYSYRETKSMRRSGNNKTRRRRGRRRRRRKGHGNKEKSTLTFKV